MSRGRVAELHQYLVGQRNSPQVKAVVEMLTLTRGRCLEKLESEDNDETRGRSKFCKELLKELSE